MDLRLMVSSAVSTMPIVSFEAEVSGKAPKEVVLVLSPASGAVGTEAPALFYFLSAPEATPTSFKAGDDCIFPIGISSGGYVPVYKFICCLW